MGKTSFKYKGHRNLGIFVLASEFQHKEHRTQMFDRYPDFPKSEALPLLCCPLIAHSHAVCARTSAACQNTRRQPLHARACSVDEIDPETIFYDCTLIMTHSGDQYTAQASVTTGGKKKSSRAALASCVVYQPL